MPVDPDLVHQAKAGQVEAVEELLTHVRGLVRRFSRARLVTYAGGGEVSEDVTQDTVIAVYLALPGWEPRGIPFEAFVYSIASNKVADAQRRYARTPFRVVDELPEQTDPDPGPEDQAMTRAEVVDALHLLDRLPPKMARVVRLRGEGLTPVEVAAVVGGTSNAVRVTHHRALRKIRAMVEEGDG